MLGLFMCPHSVVSRNRVVYMFVSVFFSGEEPDVRMYCSLAFSYNLEEISFFLSRVGLLADVGGVSPQSRPLHIYYETVFFFFFFLGLGRCRAKRVNTGRPGGPLTLSSCYFLLLLLLLSPRASVARLQGQLGEVGQPAQSAVERRRSRRWDGRAHAERSSGRHGGHQAARNRGP